MKRVIALVAALCVTHSAGFSTVVCSYNYEGSEIMSNNGIIKDPVAAVWANLIHYGANFYANNVLPFDLVTPKPSWAGKSWDEISYDIFDQIFGLYIDKIVSDALKSDPMLNVIYNQTKAAVEAWLDLYDASVDYADTIPDSASKHLRVLNQMISDHYDSIMNARNQGVKDRGTSKPIPYEGLSLLNDFENKKQVIDNVRKEAQKKYFKKFKKELLTYCDELEAIINSPISFLDIYKNARFGNLEDQDTPSSDALNSSFSLTDVNWPSNLNIGDFFDLKGTITSNLPMKKVTVGVIENGKWVKQAFKEVSPNSKNFDVSKVDAEISFNLLEEGDYTYKIVVKDERQTKTLLEKNFHVRQNKEEKSTLSISGANSPNTLQVGDYYDLEGIISSNYTISYVKVGVLKNGKWQSVATQDTYPNSKNFSITEVDRKISFNELTPGAYTYVIIAEDDKGEKTLLEHDFNVESADNNSSNIDSSSQDNSSDNQKTKKQIYLGRYYSASKNLFSATPLDSSYSFDGGWYDMDKVTFKGEEYKGGRSDCYDVEGITSYHFFPIGEYGGKIREVPVD